MTINGFEVTLDSTLLDTVCHVHHTPRFVEYEKSDEWWLVKYRFAEYRRVPSSNVYQIGNSLLMHPNMWEKFRQHDLLRP